MRREAIWHRFTVRKMDYKSRRFKTVVFDGVVVPERSPEGQTVICKERLSNKI